MGRTGHHPYRHAYPVLLSEEYHAIVLYKFVDSSMTPPVHIVSLVWVIKWAVSNNFFEWISHHLIREQWSERKAEGFPSFDWSEKQQLILLDNLTNSSKIWFPLVGHLSSVFPRGNNSDKSETKRSSSVWDTQRFIVRDWFIALVSFRREDITDIELLSRKKSTTFRSKSEIRTSDPNDTGKRVILSVRVRHRFLVCLHIFAWVMPVLIHLLSCHWLLRSLVLCSANCQSIALHSRVDSPHWWQ